MFQAESPTRVDFAGGTLDCWPLYSLLGDCLTLNLSVDIMTRASLRPRQDDQILIEIEGIQESWVFKNATEFFESNDSLLTLAQEATQFFNPKSGFELKTASESPVGGGLGGSSSLLISILKCFVEWQERVYSVNELVTIAHNLEARVLKKPTGTQDYFPALSQGMNLIRYSAQGPELETVDFPLDDLQARMTLIYTGKPHHSGLNNWQVLKRALDGDQKTWSALKEIQKIAFEMNEAFLKKDLDQFSKIFPKEYSARIRLAPEFSSPQIETLAQLASQFSSQLKICGAGGGGCVMVWSPPEKKEALIEACQKESFQVLNAQAFRGS